MRAPPVITAHSGGLRMTFVSLNLNVEMSIKAVLQSGPSERQSHHEVEGLVDAISAVIEEPPKCPCPLIREDMETRYAWEPGSDSH